MTKRVFDVVISSILLILSLPLCLIAVIGIKLSSKGPVIYKAQRTGKNNTIFTMYKFRTMHVQTKNTNFITAANDPRIFAFGKILRNLKIDEIPQLINVLLGDMSLVGPRPQDPNIVKKHYTVLGMETFRVAPGLTSPGSIYYYTHAAKQLDSDDNEKIYVEKLLPIKLALDIVYIRKASFAYDLKLIWRTLIVILCILIGKKTFKEPPEMDEARRLLEYYDIRSENAKVGHHQSVLSNQSISL